MNEWMKSWLHCHKCIYTFWYMTNQNVDDQTTNYMLSDENFIHLTPSSLSFLLVFCFCFDHIIWRVQIFAEEIWIPEKQKTPRNWLNSFGWLVDFVLVSKAKKNSGFFFWETISTQPGQHSNQDIKKLPYFFSIHYFYLCVALNDRCWWS